MYIKILGFLLLCQSFSACQQGSELATAKEANLPYKAIAVNQQSLGEVLLPATNIVFQSADGGQTWQDISAGLPQKFSVGRVFADGEEVYLASEHALYRSNAASETPVWENENLFGCANEDFFDIPISNIFHGQSGSYISSYYKGLFQKVPGTGVLIPLHANLKDKTIRTVLETADGALFVGCESGLYKTTDGGKNWKKVFADMGINSLVAADGVLLSGTYEGLLRSTDGGENWDYVLTKEGGIYRTKPIDGGFVTMADGGSTWNEVREHGMTNKIFSSTDQGKTWQRIDAGLLVNPFISNLEIDLPKAQTIFDIEQVGKYLFSSTEAGIFRSSDQGKTWELVFRNTSKRILNFAVSGKMIYAVPVAGC